MKNILFLHLVFSFSTVYAASCCVGGGTKSFIQLRNFEKYQLGLSLSYKNSYAKYDAYGVLVEMKKKETVVSSVGAGMRLRDDLDASFLIPYSRVENITGLGDVSLGARYIILDPLYLSDWYPKISLNVNLKTPTGAEDVGNGLWEPGVGFIFEKDYTAFLVNLGASYIYRSHKKVADIFSGNMVDVKEGDKFELSESFIVPVSESLSFAVGSTQNWELASQVNSNGVADSHGRSILGNISTTYFFSRFWKGTVGFDSTLPIQGWGTGLQASRSVSFISTYSFY